MRLTEVRLKALKVSDVLMSHEAYGYEHLWFGKCSENPVSPISRTSIMIRKSIQPQPSPHADTETEMRLCLSKTANANGLPKIALDLRLIGIIRA